MSARRDMPLMTCPGCGAEHEDYDGFGFLAHVGSAFERPCGWCSHPSRDYDTAGNATCGLCGRVWPAETEGS